MDSKAKWIAKYRTDFGCKARPQEICWCPVCCAMDRAWEEAMRCAVNAIKVCARATNSNATDGCVRYLQNGKTYSEYIRVTDGYITLAPYMKGWIGKRLEDVRKTLPKEHTWTEFDPDGYL